MKKRYLTKTFLKTLFLRQNNYHKYGILKHTLAVTIHALKDKNYKMIPAAIFHDIGKPYVAFQDEKDKQTGEYSFTNHEEISYQIIKNWRMSEYTKELVRYHYLIRGISKAKKKGQEGKYKRMKRSYDNLDENFIEDLKTFMKYDDLGKQRLY
ncbi:MAG: hypothetical protein BA874_00010 [Desulfuromonadales bacterium C00003068]|jgi:predicted HD phosphohydrolase|nr:MAG: hypothetical protein BA874_00010 [Desulfuromonadales bacterium C00003068]